MNAFRPQCFVCGHPVREHGWRYRLGFWLGCRIGVTHDSRQRISSRAARRAFYLCLAIGMTGRCRMAPAPG